MHPRKTRNEFLLGADTITGLAAPVFGLGESRFDGWHTYRVQNSNETFFQIHFFRVGV